MTFFPLALLGLLLLVGILVILAVVLVVILIRKSDERHHEAEVSFAGKVQDLEMALAAKTAECRNLATAVDGVMLVCRRMENRLAALEPKPSENR